MLTKAEFKNQIIEGIKAGRLDPCSGVEFGEVYEDLPQYYWCVEGDEVAEKSPLYVEDDERPKFIFGISINDVETYTEKSIGQLSNDEIEQAMLDIIEDYEADDYWYDQYLESLEA